MLTYAVVAASFYRLASGDPGGGLADKIAALVGITVAFLVVTYVAEVPERAARRQAATRAAASVRTPARLLVAAVSAFVTAKLQPFLATSSASSPATQAPDPTVRVPQTRHERRGISVHAGGRALLVLTAVAWAVLWVVKEGALDGRSGFGATALSTFVVFTVSAGFGRIAFAFFPIRFFDGDAVLRWNYRRWWRLELPALALAILVIVQGNKDYLVTRFFDDPWPAAQALLAAVVFGLVSVSLWNHFRTHAPQRAGAGSALAPAMARRASLASWCATLPRARARRAGFGVAVIPSR